MPFSLVEATEFYKIGVWYISESEDFFREISDFSPLSANSGRRLQQYAARTILTKLKYDFPLNLIIQEGHAKPILTNGAIHFNMSHTNDMAAAIISECTQVGVDIERIDERVGKIKDRFLSPEELAMIQLLGEDVLISALTLCWSIKETVFKWWGKGGVDFANDIHIKHINLDTKSIIEIEFVSKISYTLKVNCLKMENHWLTYIAQ